MKFTRESVTLPKEQDQATVGKLPSSSGSISLSRRKRGPWGYYERKL